jgi:tetratricopeptide (TPR) repeat protein
VLTTLALSLHVVAQDQIVEINGKVDVGRITGFSGTGAMIVTRTPAGGTATYPVPNYMIQSVTMTPPKKVTQLQETPNAQPGEVIAALEGPVKQYAGLKATWVVDAMAQLGDAYSQVGQDDKALEIYNNIGALYPNSPYTAVADASRAQLDLESGQVDDALKIVQPIVEKANLDLAPSPVNGSTYAKAFIVYGRVLEAQKKLPEALEAFLTVKTMYYQNPNVVAEANHYAQELRSQNPGLGVD